MKNLKRLVPESIRILLRKWQSNVRLELQLRSAPPIFVFQMGKVGSSSIYKSLLAQYPGLVAHAHIFSADHKSPRVRRLYFWAIKGGRPLKIISLTREPMARNVSAFFQMFERDTGIPYAKANFTLAELKTLFLSNYKHEIPLEWFDKNILANFGIDVYATPFPQDGSCTFSRNKIELLVMRSEINDDEKVRAVNRFLGSNGFQLRNTNIGEKKAYAATYMSFASNVKLPPDYVERMCESKYFNHFYSKAEIDMARRRWSET